MADKKVQKLQQNLLFPHGVGVELLHCTAYGGNYCEIVLQEMCDTLHIQFFPNASLDL
jgi:hypothetical protein